MKIQRKSKTDWHIAKVVTTAHKMKFSIKDLFNKCDQIAGKCGFISNFDGKLDGKLHFFVQ